jgi:hypothetical protein
MNYFKERLTTARSLDMVFNIKLNYSLYHLFSFIKVDSFARCIE